MRLTDQQIEETYRLIEQHHQEFLVSQGVRLPRLRQAGQYTKYALTLVYLAQGYPHTRTVSKKELTEFIRQYYPDVNDVQQARHLGYQKFLVALGNALGALIIPAARLVYQPKEEQPHWE